MVKFSCCSHVTSNFISVYAYGARSSVSFLTVLGDERSLFRLTDFRSNSIMN